MRRVECRKIPFAKIVPIYFCAILGNLNFLFKMIMGIGSRVSSRLMPSSKINNRSSFSRKIQKIRLKFEFLKYLFLKPRSSPAS